MVDYEAKLKWLGRKISFHDPHECELSNRIAAAWGAFSKHKEELTNKKYRLADRMRLFEAVVTSTMLYGCETWTLRVEQQRRLGVVQRKMIRMIMGAKRRRLDIVLPDGACPLPSSSTPEDSDAILEPWPDFLRRAARMAEEQLSRAGLEERSTTWRRRQAKWAADLQGRHAHKWAGIATAWQPPLHARCASGRRQARPKKRWIDDIVSLGY